MMTDKLHWAYTLPKDPHIYFDIFGEKYRYLPSEENYLGGGAMGDVYRGYRSNGAVVAVKRVKDCYSNNKMIRQRAVLEGNLGFRHSNLIEMLGCCVVNPDNGPIFLLSNFVNGENIDVYIKESLKNLPPDVRVEKISIIIKQVLDALDYLHSRGIVHRDIKPSNIMVENNSNVRLMDLGIARMSGGNQFSSAGFIGTPDYASPEQIRRDVNYNPLSSNDATMGIDAQSDIYSLGIVFYEMITGENPMRASVDEIKKEKNGNNVAQNGNNGNNGMSDVDSLTLVNQMYKKLPVNSKIPAKLMKVIYKATEKDKSKRYKTAMEFKQAIEDAYLPDPSPWESLSTWIQNNAMIVISCAFGFAVLIIILLLAIIAL